MADEKAPPSKEQIQREIAVREDRAHLSDEAFRQKYDIPADTTKPAPTPGNKGKQ